MTTSSSTPLTVDCVDRGFVPTRLRWLRRRSWPATAVGPLTPTTTICARVLCLGRPGGPGGARSDKAAYRALSLLVRREGFGGLDDRPALVHCVLLISFRAHRRACRVEPGPIRPPPPNSPHCRSEGIGQCGADVCEVTCPPRTWCPITVSHNVITRTRTAQQSACPRSPCGWGTIPAGAGTSCLPSRTQDPAHFR